MLPAGEADYRSSMLNWDGVTQTGWYGASVKIERSLGSPLRDMGRISSRFGLRMDPLGLGQRVHAGIDLPGRAGSPVLATGPGAVAFVGWAGGYGNLVIIDHGQGIRTRYGHLLRPLVWMGERVFAGSTIGLLGSTGHATGSHLHYELRVDGLAVNPLTSTIALDQRETVAFLAAAEPAGIIGLAGGDVRRGVKGRVQNG